MKIIILNSKIWLFTDYKKCLNLMTQKYRTQKDILKNIADM